jgi:energy-coupling factor transport system ATP-binding protein
MLEIKNLNFSYNENKKEPDLKNINLKIKKGEMILLCGESGCGKTTLTRLINGLIPHFYEGSINGQVMINDLSVEKSPIYETAKIIGSVFQNPRSQFFNVDTNSELVFGCENMGLPVEEIQKRFHDVVSTFNIRHLLNKSIFKLSGGEKQIIACASVSASKPQILLLDEPSSNLDSASTWDLRKLISIWKNAGNTVIIAEHRLYYLNDLIDRIIYMKDGKIHKELSRDELRSMDNKSFLQLGLRPLSLEDLSKNKKDFSPKPSKPNDINTHLNLTKFRYSYGKKIAIDIEQLEVPQNEVIAIIGKNGAGKSTFARCLCGLERKCKGLLEKEGKSLGNKERLKLSYMVMQDVNHQIFTESVEDEILLSMEYDKSTEKTEEILKNLDLLHLKDTHPMALSGGQKQRVAIGSAIASRKEIIIFDEPTSGLDLKHMKEVAYNIKKLQKKGIIIFIISHDLELILECCSHVLHFEKGKVVDNYVLDDAGEEKLKHFFINPIKDTNIPITSPVLLFPPKRC